MFQVVSELEEYDVLEEFIVSEVSSYFDEINVQYYFYMSRFHNGKNYLVTKAWLTSQDILFLRIKFPNIILQKISNIS